MFSSTELISFVFANENDTYYGDDLIKRNLNQYLWDRLHQNYEAVYFLSEETNGFAVHTYGDLYCKEYVPGKKGLFGLLSKNSNQTEFGNWLQRQLRGKTNESAAFVCPLEDFCSVLSSSQWDTVLTEIAEMKNRTGIFVLTASATTEKTAKLLLESPVFEKLQETAVTDLRGGTMQELYPTLKNRKWDNCIFLNAFDWERLRGMLLHLVMEYPKRFESLSMLDTLTHYLYAYCQNPDFADSEGLFNREMPVAYLLYKSLYDQLRNERTWQKFEAAVKKFQQNHSRVAANFSDVKLPVLRDRNSYAGRCLAIKFPGWLTRTENAAGKASGLLRSIRNTVSTPMNRVENPEIVSAAEHLLNQLSSVYPDDSETYIQILNALKFCVENVYSHSEEETPRVQAVIDKQKEFISACRDHFEMQQTFRTSLSALTGGALQTTALKQLKSKLTIREQMKQTYLDLISAMELNIKIPASEEHITDMLKKLETEIRDFDQLTRDPPETETDDTKLKEEEKYELRESLFYI